MVEREQVIEIGVAVAAVAVMLAAMLTIGSTYGARTVRSHPRVQMLVGVIVGFIFLMTAVGVGLAYTLNDPEDDLDADDDENGDAQGTV